MFKSLLKMLGIGDEQPSGVVAKDRLKMVIIQRTHLNITKSLAVKAPKVHLLYQLGTLVKFLKRRCVMT